MSSRDNTRRQRRGIEDKENQPDQLKSTQRRNCDTRSITMFEKKASFNSEKGMKQTVSNKEGQDRYFKNISESQVQEFRRFTSSRWLNGTEYFNLLTQSKALSSALDIPIVSNGEHPSSIYFEPENGQTYYLYVDDVNKLGFPRLGNKGRKEFVWKRMNFVTDLPKQKPKVSYIVASGSDKAGVCSFRMHIVWEKIDSRRCKKEGEKMTVFCHILKSEENRAMDEDISQQFLNERAKWDCRDTNQGSGTSKSSNDKQKREEDYQYSKNTVPFKQIQNTLSEIDERLRDPAISKRLSVSSGGNLASTQDAQQAVLKTETGLRRPFGPLVIPRLQETTLFSSQKTYLENSNELLLGKRKDSPEGPLTFAQTPMFDSITPPCECTLPLENKQLQPISPTNQSASLPESQSPIFTPSHRPIPSYFGNQQQFDEKKYRSWIAVQISLLKNKKMISN